MCVCVCTCVTQKKREYAVPCLNDYRRGLDWRSDLSTTFNTYLVSTFNYNAIADFHTLQIIIAHAHVFLVSCVFISRSLVMASNSGDSSTAPTKSSLYGLSYNSELLLQLFT
jgi:hypothetical protein